MNTNPDSGINTLENPLVKVIKFFWEIILNIAIVLFIGIFIIIPFQINGSSMETNYHNGEYIIVNKLSYLKLESHLNHWKVQESSVFHKFFANIISKIPLHIGDPERGDVVVIRPGVSQTATYYLKRIIGLPGDTVRIAAGKVYIKTPAASDFVEVNEPYLSTENKDNTHMPLNVHEHEFLVPEWQYWVLGDNRTASSDSRNCFFYCEDSEDSHYIDRANVVGKVLLSLGHFNIFSENEFPKLGTLSWKVKPRLLDTKSSANYPELE